MAATVRKAKELVDRLSSIENKSAPVIESEVKKVGADGDFRIEARRAPGAKGMQLIAYMATDPSDRSWTQEREDGLKKLATAYGWTVLDSPYPLTDYIIRDATGDRNHEIMIHGSRLEGPLDMSPKFIQDFGRLFGAQTAKEKTRNPSRANVYKS
ncbi:MAG: hypothetical protein HYS81_02095 [Candidatus Aenigmatarchaeota archaeon]|nr:MAG: hypothetical protein HYS81_02095 [Candidatus Aenigmarchaeota archaeon]